MKRCHVVIGKNFGDEGKGQLTYNLAKKAQNDGHKTLVIRHNGGAQAGHTVEDESRGYRFIFHQLGSASNLGIATYHGDTYLPDPMKLGDEIEANRVTNGVEKSMDYVYASENCHFVTIYDVLLNSLKEENRGNKRHGSCGMGIFETYTRIKNPSFAYTLKDLKNLDVTGIINLLKTLRDNYTLPALKNQGLPMNNSWGELILDDQVLENASELLHGNMNRYIRLISSDREQEFIESYDEIIFENGQGLLLDEDNMEYFPHLTPSHTGLHNPKLFLDRWNLDLEEKPVIHYITRTYVTRHGKGRLDYECPKMRINENMIDLTNVPNPWQETLRYGLHPDIEQMFAPILTDRAQMEDEVNTMLHVTHLNETEGKILFSNEALSVEWLQSTAEKYHILVTQE